MGRHSHKHGAPRAYTYYERRFGDGYNRRCIDGSITNDSNCVGYCTSLLHQGFLTQELYEKHDCKGKKCCRFSQKDRVKVPKPIFSSRPNDDKLANDIFSYLLVVLSEYESVRLLSVKRNGPLGWIARYVSISNSIPFLSIAEGASEKFDTNISFEQLNCDFDRAVQLILT